MEADNTIRESWNDLYLQAILEVDPQKMPERISAARQTIAGRLRDLEQDSDHHSERHEMEDAIHKLVVLEAESKEWQGGGTPAPNE